MSVCEMTDLGPLAFPSERKSRRSLLYLSGDGGMDSAVRRDPFNLQVSAGNLDVMTGDLTRWKPFKFLWQVIWNTDAVPCRDALVSQHQFLD